MIAKVVRRPRPYCRTGSSHTVDVDAPNGSDGRNVSTGSRRSWVLSPIRHASRIRGILRG
jgi:hypothetical protein